jgi:hypothetical protein
MLDPFDKANRALDKVRSLALSGVKVRDYKAGRRLEGPRLDVGTIF